MNIRVVITSAVITFLMCALFIGITTGMIHLGSWANAEDFPRPQPKASVKVAPAKVPSHKSQPVYFKVMATREGLVGKRTACGHLIKAEDQFVALPSRKALRRTVEVRYDNRVIRCPVLDVGPHSTKDPYWETDTRPLSESGKRIPAKWGRAKNKAGIDLSDGLWDAFGITRGTGIVEVQWRFVEPGE